MEVDGADLMVIIRRVIANALVEIIAGGIDGDFVFAVAEVTAAALLVDGMEDVEELADAGEFVVGGKGVGVSEDGFDEAGLGREVARETDGAQATAVLLEWDVRGESVGRGGG